jgi:two-component system response regulator RegX3
MKDEQVFDCLIVDDEQALSESTLEYLEMSGVRTAWARTGAECMDIIRKCDVGMLLLDVNLGGESGFSLCKELRDMTDIPILFISARGSDDDVLLALGVGGDDYIRKPYSLGVLLAKVKAVLRRQAASGTGEAARATSAGGAGDRFSFGDFTLRYDLERLFGGNDEIPLTQMEYRLLSYLAKSAGRVVSKDEIFREVWGDAITGDGTLNVHVRRLREKIEDDPANPVRIKTVWGTGYLLEPDGQEIL